MGLVNSLRTHLPPSLPMLAAWFEDIVVDDQIIATAADKDLQGSGQDNALTQRPIRSRISTAGRKLSPQFTLRISMPQS